ncbi:MAG: hypothetical protein M1482_03040, partial [Chloroflexi bacterium]|nr:hypothetical protein [Chloroflexota bacterium]
GTVHTRPRRLIWLALTIVFLGLACNPLGSYVAANSTPTSAPPATANVPVAILPTSAPRAAVNIPVAVIPTAAASPASTATSLPPTFAERSVKVDALFVTSGTPAAGGMSPIEIRVRPAEAPGQLRVGFLEEEVGGTGPQWHAAGWEAILIASMLTGVDPTNYEFTFSADDGAGDLRRRDVEPRGGRQPGDVRIDDGRRPCQHAQHDVRRLLGKDGDYRVAVLSGQGEQVLTQKMGSGLQEAATKCRSRRSFTTRMRTPSGRGARAIS